MSQVQVTLIKSVIGRPGKHRAVVDSLGLRKINQKVCLNDTAENRGMIDKVIHLLAVEQINKKGVKAAKPEAVEKKVESIAAGFGGI